MSNNAAISQAMESSGEMASAALIQSQMRESELIGKHFDAVAELNVRHMRREATLMEEIGRLQADRAELEKSLAALERSLAESNWKLQASAQPEEKLKTELRSKARMIARLERELGHEKHKNASIEAQIVAANAELTAKNAEADSLRQEMRDSIGRLNGEIASDRAAFGQWAGQASYILTVATDHLAIQQRAGWWARCKNGEQVNSVLEFAKQWRSDIGNCAGVEQQPMNEEGGGALSLERLLALHDQQFVRSAYVTLLHREPDAEGNSHYLRRIREGAAKLTILGELRMSAEGRVVDPGIVGLDRAIKRYRLAQLPVAGWLFARLFGIERDSRLARKLRAHQNAVGALLSGADATHAELLAIHL